jgi:hypothetical protein
MRATIFRGLGSLRSTFLGAFKLALVYVAIGLLALPILDFGFGVPFDQATAFLAVPLLLLYVIWRISRMFLSPTDKYVLHIQATGAIVSVVAMLFACVSLLIVAGLSAPVYFWLGLDWAFGLAMYTCFGVLLVGTGCAAVIYFLCSDHQPVFHRVANVVLWLLVNILFIPIAVSRAMSRSPHFVKG